MKLPITQPQTNTPNTSDFVGMQTQWAQILEPFLKDLMAGDGVPVGAVTMWAGTTAPAKYLILSGQVLLQKLYPQLFLVIKTTYNTGGEAAGSFRLPANPGLALPAIIKYLP